MALSSLVKPAIFYCPGTCQRSSRRKNKMSRGANTTRELVRNIRAEHRAVTLLTCWQTIGRYEYEYNERGYTGWYRCVGGRQANGLWPQWNINTGATR